MSGCFGRDPEDRMKEAELDAYLSQPTDKELEEQEELNAWEADQAYERYKDDLLMND